MQIYPYDSFDTVCKSPFGAVPAGSQVTFSILLTDFVLPISCDLLLYKADAFDTPTRYQMHIDSVYVGCNRFICSVPLPMEAYLYFYCFEVVTAEGVKHIRRVDTHNGDFDEDGALWQLTVYEPSYQTPALENRGIIYQIFPDRFYNSGRERENVPADRTIHPTWGGLPEFRPNQNGVITNSDYFGGDLLGIVQKLDYLASLHVSLIYLNPIFEAHSNHRYNVADYFKVDPLLGTNEDFVYLCQEAAKYGIGIVLDGVFSHTGSDSVYFNKERRYGGGGAYNDPNCRYKSWYKFNEYPHNYHSWWGFDTLPEIIEETPDFLDFICGEQGVIRYWMGLGARGFRLDVADELPDVILDRLRCAVKESNPDGILIGEVWEDASNKIAYSQRRRYLLGRQLDSVMNYPFMNAILRYVRYGDCAAVYHGVLSILENYPPPSIRLLFNSLSTHDTPRAITALAAEEYTGGDREWQAAHYALSPEQYKRGCRLLVLAYTLLYFLPGLPCLYYGDEAGVVGWRDPFNRTPYPWGSEDAALVRVFKQLGQIYADTHFLPEAAFRPVTVTNDILIYVRQHRYHVLSVAVNRGGNPHNIGAVLPPGGKIQVLAGSFENGVLQPLSAIVVIR